MNYYDEQLKQLQTQMAEKKRLEAVLTELRSQYKDLSVKVKELESKKLVEQADVEKLEGRSLAAFFYNVVGKMDEKLTKEKQEAYEASVKYDVACRELKAVEEDIQFRERELEKVKNSERQYRSALKAKQEAMKEADISEAVEIVKLEELIAQQENQKQEISEAVRAGQEAEKLTDSILESLSGAEDWGTWDMLGGGLLADVAKYGHLDDAQAKVEDLQEALRCFKTELADIDIQADMQIAVDDFLRFADYFFDNLFTDWAVMDSIHESQNQVQKTQEQIQEVLGKLSVMKDNLEKEMSDTYGAIEEIVKQAAL